MVLTRSQSRWLRVAGGCGADLGAGTAERGIEVDSPLDTVEEPRGTPGVVEPALNRVQSLQREFSAQRPLRSSSLLCGRACEVGRGDHNGMERSCRRHAGIQELSKPVRDKQAP